MEQINAARLLKHPSAQINGLMNKMLKQEQVTGTKKTEDVRKLKMDAAVIVHNLKGCKEWNGLAGSIVTMDVYSGLFSVALENGHLVNVDEANLELMDQDKLTANRFDRRRPVQQSFSQ